MNLKSGDVCIYEVQEHHEDNYDSYNGEQLVITKVELGRTKDEPYIWGYFMCDLRKRKHTFFEDELTLVNRGDNIAYNASNRPAELKYVTLGNRWRK